jgi:Ca-activated chloride channel family protein
VVQPPPAQQRDITLFDGKITVTLTEQVSSVKPVAIRLVRPWSDESGLDIPPIEIVEALNRLKLYRLQEQARLEVTAGEYNQASEHLHRLASHLLSQGERGLARTVLLEAEHIQQNKSFSQQGQKEIKYGTRALVKTGRSEEL